MLLMFTCFYAMSKLLHGASKNVEARKMELACIPNNTCAFLKFEYLCIPSETNLGIDFVELP